MTIYIMLCVHLCKSVCVCVRHTYCPSGALAMQTELEREEEIKWR